MEKLANKIRASEEHCRPIFAEIATLSKTLEGNFGRRPDSKNGGKRAPAYIP